jgi:DNA gyrase subunit B
MSVDADEHVLVRTSTGVRLVEIGAFIDDALGEKSSRPYDKLVTDRLGEVLCFGVDSKKTRFKRIRAVIRHPVDEPLFEVKTAYGRRLRITASHSVFAYEDDKIVLKRGDAIRPGDRVVAPSTIDLSAEAPSQIDLLRALHAVPHASQVWARGPAVEDWYRYRVTDLLPLEGSRSASEASEGRGGTERPPAAEGRSSEYRDRPEWVEARVQIPAEVGRKLAQWRVASGVSGAALCDAIGIRQPCTFYSW